MTHDVAIVVPVRNEAATIVPLLESFERLTVFPEEVILVDGGSTDGTVEAMNRYLEGRKLPYGVRVIILPDALPGRGRNEGIRRTRCSFIACTDAGGRADPRWLEDLMAPMEQDPGCEMVIGKCLPELSNFFERCTFYVNLESPRSRSFIFFGGASIAFRKSLWQKVGGYPEDLYPCEDKAFLRKVKRRGLSAAVSDGGIVYWRSRSTLWDFFKQFFLYGRGDAQGRFVPHRYCLRALFYGTVLFLGWQGRWGLAILFLAGYLGVVSVRGWRRLKRGQALGILPVLFLTKDIAQLLGYLAGHFRRRR